MLVLFIKWLEKDGGNFNGVHQLIVVVVVVFISSKNHKHNGENSILTIKLIKFTRL